MSKKVIVCSIPSDSHTWNLIYMQFLLEEYGYEVVNLGCCLPVKDLIMYCHKIKPEMVVISTINGHGSIEGKELIFKIKECDMLRNIMIFIGGELTVNGDLSEEQQLELLNLGFQGVFSGQKSIGRFIEIIRNDFQSLAL